MPLPFHPEMGTIVICDFDGEPPEMDKRRPAVVISPKFKYRDGLCTVVPLSITEPYEIMPYHYKLYFPKQLPPPFNSEYKWAKGDMLATVSFDRLNLPYEGKDDKGKRKYLTMIIETEDLRRIRDRVL